MATKFLRRKGASRYVEETWGIPLSPSTLAKYATRGGGPPYYKVGRFPLYTITDLDQSEPSASRRKAQVDVNLLLKKLSKEHTRALDEPRRQIDGPVVTEPSHEYSQSEQIGEAHTIPTLLN